MKPGDTVILKYDPGDLRQPIGPGSRGVIQRAADRFPIDDDGRWWWVKWRGQEEAMLHYQRELEPFTPRPVISWNPSRRIARLLGWKGSSK